MESKLLKGSNEKVFTPEEREEIFCTVCDQLCKYRAQYEEPDDPELSEHCRVCPLFNYL